MAVTRVAYVVPPAGAAAAGWPGDEDYPLHVAQGVLRAAPGAFAITLLVCGETATETVLAPGLTRRILPTTRQPWHPLNTLSWDLLPALENVDIVHLFQPLTRAGELALLLARLRRIAVYMTVYGESSSKLIPELELFDLAERVFFPTQAATSLLPTSCLGEVLPGGVDSSFFTPAEPEERREYVLCVGPLLPESGVAELVQAWPRELPLTISGPCSSQDFLEDLRRLAREKRVTFLSAVSREELRTLYRRAWATIFPAATEAGAAIPAGSRAVGLSLLNSLACGTPVLCTRTHGLAELVHPGQTGLIYQDEDELTRGLRDLVGDHERTRQLGENGRRMVKRHWDLHAVGARVQAAYQGRHHDTRRAAG